MNSPLPPPPHRQGRATGSDVLYTVAAWVILAVIAATALWFSLFFGFAADGCPTDGCPAVPLNIDELVYPVTWGGIAVGLAVAALGPIVSLWRHRRMWIWPVVGIGIVIAAFAAGVAMTAYSQTFW